MKILKLDHRNHVNNMHTQKPINHFESALPKILKTLKSLKLLTWKRQNKKKIS